MTDSELAIAFTIIDPEIGFQFGFNIFTACQIFNIHTNTRCCNGEIRALALSCIKRYFINLI